MLKILLVLFMIFLSLPGFSQEETETTVEPLSEQGGQVTIRETPEPEPTPEGQEAAATLNEDESVAELQAAREEQLEKINLIQKTTEPLAKPIRNPLKEIQQLGHEQLNAAALMDDKVLAIFQQMIKDGHMARITPEALKTQVMEKTKGTYLGNFLHKYPVWVDIFVEVMRSKEALGGLMGILVRKSDLKTYGYIWLAIFVFGALIKKRIIKPKWDFKKRFAWSMSISFILSTGSLLLFYNFFSEELNPTLSIAARHLF